MTQEDWNEVLYNGMEKTSSWAALYFIALMTFGNYVLFNLLVAILVEGFSTEDEPKKLEDRIRADAIQAIVSQEAVSAAKRKSSARRPSSIQMQSGDSNFTSQKNNYRLRKRNEVQSSITSPTLPPMLASTPAPTIQIPKPTFATETIPSLLNQDQDVPIIIHTCPTPAQTPPSSSLNRSSLKRANSTSSLTRRGSTTFRLPNKSYKILFNTNICDQSNKVNDDNNNNIASANAVCEQFLLSHTDSLRRVRKMSLDSRRGSITPSENNENSYKSKVSYI